MTKIFNFALKIKGVAGRVAHENSSDPATPSKFEMCTRRSRVRVSGMVLDRIFPTFSGR